LTLPWSPCPTSTTTTTTTPDPEEPHAQQEDAYVADARTRWQTVEVGDEPDAGPAGYDGATHIPATLDHPLAGQTIPATTQED
jgi:hypothetical protein